MGKRVVHYVAINPGEMCDIWYRYTACSTPYVTDLSGDRYTKNKPDVTCEHCLKAMRKGGDDGS